MLYIPNVEDYLEILTDEDETLWSKILASVFNLQEKKCI